MELILVIILISVVYSLVFVNFDFEIKEKKVRSKIENLKQILLNNFDFQEELSLDCIQNEGLVCYVFIDGRIDKNIKIEGLFNKVPDVYTLEKKELVNYFFEKVKLDNIEYEPFFELKIDKYKKHKDLIVDMGNSRVYFFSSIFLDAKLYKYTNEIIDSFSSKETEVKDALQIYRF